MPRFVVLRHEMPADSDRPSHWDFMLQQGEALRTWALAEEPRAGREVAAEQLADHRLAYLDYEGPVSGDRGTVTRWDQGEYRLIDESERQLQLELQGEQLDGRAVLTQSETGDQRWTLNLIAD